VAVVQVNLLAISILPHLEVTIQMDNEAMEDVEIVAAVEDVGHLAHSGGVHRCVAWVWCPYGRTKDSVVHFRNYQ
jgi:hypothetical protein